MTAAFAPPFAHNSEAINGIGSNDRVGFTLFIAVLFHAIIILGVTFIHEDKTQHEVLPTLDIILVQSQNSELIDNPDYLAQSNQEGGGESDDKAHPSAPVSAATPVDRQGVAPIRQEEADQIKQPKPKTQIITTTLADTQFEKNPAQPDENDPLKNMPSNITQRRLEIARLQAELSDSMQTYAKRPKLLTLSARTREAIEASYLEAWVRKVERVGNLNYPDAVRRQKISGSLRLNIRLNAEGEVLRTSISRSSGNTLLDQAAIHIVALASPFAEFPITLRKKADQINIIRTWEFSSQGRLSSNE
ncbi:MAG: energy transducer TonB [Gammaproteobacteria bacterium]|nr:energy transducer TonB [Gammaproteobacteria bacterium]